VRLYVSPILTTDYFPEVWKYLMRNSPCPIRSNKPNQRSKKGTATIYEAAFGYKGAFRKVDISSHKGKKRW